MSRAPRWSEVTALFGGAFDPPHLGHREAVGGLFEYPGVKRVLVVPTPFPKYKPCIASVESRLAMTQLCFGADSENTAFCSGDVSIDLTEIKRGRRNPGVPTYTYDTLLELKPKYLDLAFVLGADQLSSMDSWHRFPEVLKLSHWIVLTRKPDGVQMAQNALKRWEEAGIATKSGPGWLVRGADTWIEIFETPAPQISSTQIREALGRTGEPPARTLLGAVSRYLIDHGLYGTRKHL